MQKNETMKMYRKERRLFRVMAFKLFLSVTHNNNYMLLFDPVHITIYI